MPVKAGRYDQRVTIQNLTETQDVSGEPIQSWSDQIETWAMVMPQKGIETFQRSQTLSKAMYIFRIRFNTGITITEKHRLVYLSDNYDIESIVRAGRRANEYWEILGKRVA